MRPRRRYSQHFLEPPWADKLVEAMAPEPGDVFLEIGPGRGALTLRLAPRVEHVTAIEVDPGMVRSLRPHLPENVTLLAGDFLDVDLRRHAPPGAPPMRVAGNLPYHVSSPILFKLLNAQRDGLPIRDATLMLQREVADRIEAAPGGREFGTLSIFVQLRADVRRLLTLPPGAFRPAPRVHSAVVRLGFRAPEVSIADEGIFEGLVRAIFTQRRKMLANALRGFAELHDVDPSATLAAANIDGRRRPETLQLAELARLADVFATRSR
jgi:16S rRNA (adenine1518-N6/adenine1519-N6)-dimethyltransferase